MNVQMWDSFACVRTVVDHQSKPRLMHTERTGGLAGDKEQLT